MMSHSSVAWVGHFLLQQQQAVISCILQQHFPRITGRHKAVKSEVLRFFFVQVRSAFHYYQQPANDNYYCDDLYTCLRFAVYLYACKSIK